MEAVESAATGLGRIGWKLATGRGRRTRALLPPAVVRRGAYLPETLALFWSGCSGNIRDGLALTPRLTDIVERGVPHAPPHRDGAAVRRVLLAEDDAAERARLGAILAEADYSIVEAGSGEDALGAYVREPTQLVLLDLDLPGLSGVEVCRRIRAIDAARATYVLVYSRCESLAALVTALDAGADDYILLPRNADIVRTRIAIAERRLAREEVRRVAEADAARARYLAGVGEMAIALQHEINNPLAAILAHAELMAMDAHDAGRPDDSLATILEQARRIADVVRRLSSLRNPTSVEYVPGKRMVHLHDDG